MPLATHAVDKHSSSDMPPKHDELSSPQLLTIRQNPLKVDAVNGQYIHSSHHSPHLDEPSFEPLYDQMVMNSHIAQQSTPGVRHMNGSSEHVHQVISDNSKVH